MFRWVQDDVNSLLGGYGCITCLLFHLRQVLMMSAMYANRYDLRTALLKITVYAYLLRNQ